MNKIGQRVMVLGTCTSWSIAAALRKNVHFSEVDSRVVYSMSPQAIAQQAELLVGYDKILTLDHSHHYGQLSTASLKASFPDKVVTMPTPFFSGLAPDLVYFKNKKEHARAEGEMGDYHSALVLRECQDGLSCDDVVQRYESGEAFERLNIQGVWQDSLNELQAREAETDIVLSDYIESRTESGEIVHDFLTINHPSEGLINDVVQKFIAIVVGENAGSIPLKPSEHGLNSGSRWPFHPAVARAMNLEPLPEQTYRGRSSSGIVEFSAADFAKARYDYFCVINQPGSFEISSPFYVKARLK
jgi:hypothetical protein